VERLAASQPMPRPPSAAPSGTELASSERGAPTRWGTLEESLAERLAHSNAHAHAHAMQPATAPPVAVVPSSVFLGERGLRRAFSPMVDGPFPPATVVRVGESAIGSGSAQSAQPQPQPQPITKTRWGTLEESLAERLSEAARTRLGLEQRQKGGAAADAEALTDRTTAPRVRESGCAKPSRWGPTPILRI